MCGICGIVEPSHPVRRDTIQKMMEAMVHRGPDDAGDRISDRVGLGFRRLSIIDLEGGHQPMSTEDHSIWSVVNGEIYNYKELRGELQARGHQFRSDSDAEVVPHLYEEWGIEGIQRLRGMFALAVHDSKNDTLYLARDHFGIKPLYYAVVNGRLAFASEIKSLLASQMITPRVDPQSLWYYLTFQYVPDPLTMLEGVFKLPPAHILRYRRGAVHVERYWALTFQPDSQWDLPTLTKAIEASLRESVRRHRVSDVPVGAYLSSGIDSSAVVALLKEHQEVNTFSIGFPGNHGEVNELSAAQDTAHLLGTRHHEVMITPEQYQQAFRRIIYHQEDPIADPSAPALYFLAEAARRHVTVVLSGEGADELFAGYPIYQEPYALQPFELLPPALRSWVGRQARRMPPGMKGRGYLERGSLPLEHRFIGNAKMFLEDEKRTLVVQGINPEAVKSPFSIHTSPDKSG